MAIRKPAKPPRKKRAPARRDILLWEELAAIGRRVPKHELAKLPRDLAKNFDHYHDGSPRQD